MILKLYSHFIRNGDTEEPDTDDERYYHTCQSVVLPDWQHRNNDNGAYDCVCVPNAGQYVFPDWAVVRPGRDQRRNRHMAEMDTVEHIHLPCQRMRRPCQ